jgi:TatD DNase family protein
MFTDSHCHLNFPELAQNMDAIRTSMAEAQVDRALVISTQLEKFPEVHGLAMQFDNFWATVGVHPDSEGVQEPSVEELVKLSQLPRVVGIGETGLDYPAGRALYRRYGMATPAFSQPYWAARASAVASCDPHT